MRAATQATFVAVVFACTAINAAAAMYRCTVTTLPPPDHTEYALWFISTIILTVTSVILIFSTRNVEIDERQKTKQQRACQAQRNSTVFSESLLAFNGIGVIGFFLPLVDLGKIMPALTMYAALGLIVSTGWYLASTWPYAPLPRLKHYD